MARAPSASQQRGHAVAFNFNQALHQAPQAARRELSGNTARVNSRRVNREIGMHFGRTSATREATAVSQTVAAA